MTAPRSFLLLTLLAPLAAAAEEPMLLSPGASVTRAVAEGQEHAYRLDVRQGQCVRAVIEQAGVDVAATVRGPDGGLVLETSSPNTAFGPNPLVFVAAADGLQEITLRADSWRTGGSYTLRVEAVREPTGDDRERAEAVAVNGRWTALLRNDATRRESIPVLLDARARWQALGDTWMEMWTGLSLGAVLSGVLGEPQPSVEALERPLQIALTMRDEYAEARVRYNLGDSVGRLGRIAEAREHFERAAALHRAAGLHNDLSRVLIAQANLLGEAGFDQESLDLRYEAFRIAESLPETLDKPVRQERATLALANAYLRVNEPALALETLDRPFPALAASDRNGHSSVWMARGAAYRDLGDDTRAYEAWLEAYEDRDALGNRPLLAEVLMRLSDLHLGAGEWDASLALVEEADAILETAGRRPARASAQCRLGRTHLAAGAPASAAASFTRALEFAGEANAGARRCATAGLGQAALAAGDLEQALRHAEAAVALVESRRDGLASADDRAGVLSRDAEAYELLGHVRMRLHASAPDAGHAAAALTVAEANRARSLLDVIAKGRRDGAADDPRARPLDAGAIARALDADTILLEYALGDDASYLWVVSRDALQAYALPPRSAIQAAARPVRERLASVSGSGVDAGAAADARRLSDLLLGPAAELLGSKRLLVVAADVLQYVPFAALPDPRTPDGTPLLARHLVVQAPSASAAVAIRSRPAATARGPVVAVLADPVYERRDPRIAAAARTREAGEDRPPRLALRGSSLARLPFSRAEADAIARAARPGRAHRALGFDATRAAVRGSALQDARIVHFAAHGVVDSARAARAGIVLSLFDRQGRPQEGFLGLRDVYELRLSADLVVLSGCQTALGRDLRGEGLVGLTGGFLHAGARQVVASLWRVDDLATSDLMARFYGHLLRGGRPAAEALRAAQLEMAAVPRWRDPYFWAGFVVVGDWR